MGDYVDSFDLRIERIAPQLINLLPKQPEAISGHFLKE